MASSCFGLGKCLFPRTEAPEPEIEMEDIEEACNKLKLSQPKPNKPLILKRTNAMKPRRKKAPDSAQRNNSNISQMQYDERMSYRREIYQLQLKWKAEKEKRKMEERAEYIKKTTSRKKVNNRVCSVAKNRQNLSHEPITAETQALSL